MYDISFEKLYNGELCEAFDSHEDVLWLRSQGMDISGGKITMADIERLESYPKADRVRISGLRQDTFEFFIRKYGQNLRIIEFYKNKLVEDWSLLGMLPNVEYLYWFSNQRIDRMWDMTGNIMLKGVCISDFTRLHKLDGCGKPPALRYFAVRDAAWDKTEIESFLPLAGTGITHLGFGGKRVTDKRIDFINQMPNLEQIYGSRSIFTKEQIEWISTHHEKIQIK